MTSLNDLPQEVLVHILSYLYQDKNKNISYRYHLDNHHINLVNKRFSKLIEQNRNNLLIHDPTYIINYYWAKNLIND